MPKTRIAKTILNLIDIYGKNYEPALLPADIPRGPTGLCFDWCLLQAVKSYGKYQYVEGIALDPETHDHGILHAWMTDGVHAFDPTWQAIDTTTKKDTCVPTLYAGIAIDVHDAYELLKANGKYQGILANRWRIPKQVDAVLRKSSTKCIAAKNESLVSRQH